MKIFITGASKGLGFSLVKEFLNNRDSVWGIGRSNFDKAILGGVATGQFTYSECETSSKDEVRKTFDNMLALDFIPDIAIFCAGSATEDIADSNFKIENFKDNFDVNLFGILYWIELLLPFFTQRKNGIFAGISSMSVLRENHKNRIGYSASKAALNKSFENLRMQYFGTGVRFVIFNMGRMGKKERGIGIGYDDAASAIRKVLTSKRIPEVAAIPKFQSVLTQMSTFIPKRFYNRFIFK